MSRIVTQAFTTTPDNSLHIRKARLNFHNVAHTCQVEPGVMNQSSHFWINTYMNTWNIHGLILCIQYVWIYLYHLYLLCANDIRIYTVYTYIYIYYMIILFIQNSGATCCIKAKTFKSWKHSIQHWQVQMCSCFPLPTRTQTSWLQATARLTIHSFRFFWVRHLQMSQLHCTSATNLVQSVPMSARQKIATSKDALDNGTLAKLQAVTLATAAVTNILSSLTIWQTIMAIFPCKL